MNLSKMVHGYCQQLKIESWCPISCFVSLYILTFILFFFLLMLWFLCSFGINFVLRNVGLTLAWFKITSVLWLFSSYWKIGNLLVKKHIILSVCWCVYSNNCELVAVVIDRIIMDYSMLHLKYFFFYINFHKNVRGPHNLMKLE